MKFFAEIRKEKETTSNYAYTYRWTKNGFVFPGLSRNGPQHREVFSGNSGFPLFSKTNISKLQFDWNAQAFLNDFLGLRGLTNQTFTYILKTWWSYVYDIPEKVLQHVSLNGRSEGNYIAA